MGAYWVGFWHGVAVTTGAWLAAGIGAAFVFARRMRARDGIEP